MALTVSRCRGLLGTFDNLDWLAEKCQFIYFGKV